MTIIITKYSQIILHLRGYTHIHTYTYTLSKSYCYLPIESMNCISSLYGTLYCVTYYIINSHLHQPPPAPTRPHQPLICICYRWPHYFLCVLCYSYLRFINYSRGIATELSNVHCAPLTLVRVLYAVRCTLYVIHCTLYTEQYIVYIGFYI